MERRTFGKGKSNKKSEIVRYIFKCKNASKTELTKVLEISMPTVLQSTKELLEQGILQEAGEYESTGGRRAKSLTINGNKAYAAGMDITGNHVSFVLINLKGEIISYEVLWKDFNDSLAYYREIFQELEAFIERHGLKEDNILGVGVALPGIIDRDEKVLIKSHALKLENFGLSLIAQMCTRVLHFENDTNAAMEAECTLAEGDAIYLFLSRTVGGAFRTDGDIFRGNNRKAGELGHTILVPGGRICQCGTKGCVNAYCSIQALEKASGYSFEETMARVAAKDPQVLPVWNEYLDYLAITVSNLRMMYDTDIILGGDMSAYLEPYMLDLGKRVMEINKFDRDIGYLKISKFKKGGAAAGAALRFIHKYINEIC